MKKTIIGISVLSLSLFLCACSSSAPDTAADSQPEESQQTETDAGQEESQVQPGLLSFDDFEITYTTKPTEQGYDGIYVSITNNTAGLLLSGEIEYTLKAGVTAEDVQAAMPDGIKYDPDGYERNGNRILPERGFITLEPSETSPERAILIDALDEQDDLLQECTITPEILDLLEIQQFSGDLIVDGQLKMLRMSPGDSIPYMMLDDSYNKLNIITEGGKDLIIVPEGVSLYTTYETKLGNTSVLLFNFYDVEQSAMDQCIEDYKSMYPNQTINGLWAYGGDDGNGHNLQIFWNEDDHIINGQISMQ